MRKVRLNKGVNRQRNLRGNQDTLLYKLGYLSGVTFSTAIIVFTTYIIFYGVKGIIGLFL